MKKYITKQSDIKGAGKGLFTKAAFKKGEVIGLAHVDDQPYSEIGHNHNHKEENPTAFSKKIDNKRYIFASRDLKPGEEITTNYRLQPELEQPEDFEKKKGGMVSLPKDKPEKSKKFSRSLDATNRLYTENNLFKKPKSRRNKVFDPHAKYYAEGGTYEEAELTPEEIEAYRAEGYTVDDNEYQDGVPTSPEEWGQQIKDIEGQIGNPSGWTLSDYNTLQNKLNEYKSWRENTPEGQAVIDTHNEEGEYDIPLPEHLQDYTNAMMKARLAYANEFGNPAAKRMINLPDTPYQFDNGDTGTHYMASMDNYAVPQIQDENGVLQLGDYGPESNEAIRFDSDEDANYFAENYKDVSPGFLNQKKKGGSSGCPKGEYWNGTKCVKIPKNTRIVYHTDKDVYDKAFAAESDSSHFYNNAKSDFNKVNAFQSRIRTPGLSPAEQDKRRDAYFKERDRQEKKWHTDNYEPGTTINHKYKGPKSNLKIKPVGLERNDDGYAFPIFKKPVIHNVYEEPIVEEEFIPMPVKVPELINTTTGDIIGQSEQLLAPEYSANYPENRIGYKKYNWNTTKSGLNKRQPNTGGFYKKASKKVEDLRKYMEGYEDEEGNYIPGEIENAETEGRQIKFKGNFSKADKEAQENYNKEYDEYENLKNYQNQIMNLMQYKLNKMQDGGSPYYSYGNKKYIKKKDGTWLVEYNGQYVPLSKNVEARSAELNKNAKYNSGNREAKTLGLDGKYLTDTERKEIKTDKTKRQKEYDNSNFLSKMLNDNPKFEERDKLLEGSSSGLNPYLMPTGIGPSGLVKGVQTLASKVGASPVVQATKQAYNTAVPLGKTITNVTGSTLTPRNLLFSYWAAESAYNQADPKSDVRKSQSNFINNPSLNTLGDASFETGVNSLGFSGLGLGKQVFKPAYNTSKNLIKGYKGVPILQNKHGGLNKFVEGGPTDCGEGYKWNEELQECVEDTSKYNEKSYAKHLAEKKIYEDALKEIEVGTTEYAILEEAYNAKVKKLEKEKERVLKVRGNVIPASKALDEADDLISKTGAGPLYTDFIYAKNPKELALARKALPQEIKNVLPNQGLYNVAKWDSKTNKWDEGLHPGRELYCTPYGCFAYQKAGASDVPIIGGNIDFANRAATGDFVFEKINPNERQPGDMALMVEMAPNDYSDPDSGMSRRPHHTTIYAEPDPKFPKDTKKGNFYNALDGNRLFFDKSKLATDETPGDRFDYYRYVGAQNKINNEVLDLAKQKEEFNIKQEQRKNNAALPSIPTLKPNLITQNNTATLQYPKKEEKLKNKRKLFKNKSFELGGLHKFAGGGEPCPQGFQEDPVTGECVSIMGQKERVQRIEEVPINQYSKYITEYEEANPRDAFVYKKKADYLKKNKGLNRQYGLSQDNFPENAENNFNKNWEYNRNSFVINQFAKDHGINPKNHVEIVEKMADKGSVSYDMIANSKYGSKLQPSFWAKSLAGAQELANFMAKQAGEKGDAFNYQTPGLTKKEWEDIHNSSIGALETTSLIDIPGAEIGNSIADLSTATGGNYQESPGLLSGELKSNVSPFKASLLNPINYVGLINSVSKTQALNKLLLGNLLNPLNYEGKERSLPGSPNANFLNKKDEYIETELTPEEIEEYRRGGFTVEELY